MDGSATAPPGCRADSCSRDAVVDPIREVVADFRIPLAEAIRGYWCWALKIANTASYDHTDAYEHLVKVIDRAVDTRSERLDGLVGFVDSCRTIDTRQK